MNTDYHTVATIIKDLEDRITALEQDDEEASTSNPLRTYYESMSAGDTAPVVEETSLNTAYWNGESSGWQTSVWGEGSYEPETGGENDLTVQSGETHTVSSGDSESYEETFIESGGELVQESDSELHTTGSD